MPAPTLRAPASAMDETVEEGADGARAGQGAFQVLVHKIQEVLTKVENFEVVLHTPPEQVARHAGALCLLLLIANAHAQNNDLRVLTQPFKLTLERDPNATDFDKVPSPMVGSLSCAPLCSHRRHHFVLHR